jgi:hypothetical protein
MKTQDLAHSAPAEQAEEVSDSDILAMLPMLDYLIAEISRFDRVCAHHLVSARTSLAQAVAHCVVRAH